jgi:hypothetical protein
MFKILFALIVTSSLAFAFDSKGGGGGGAIVCRNDKHKIVSAQLYDLYEAPYYFGYQFVSSNQNPRDQLLRVIQKLNFNKHNIPVLMQTIESIIKKIEFLPAGVTLQAPNDMGIEYPIIKPEECEVEGVGFYTSKGQLKVSLSVYQSFSNLDKAACILHEALYLLDREVGSPGLNPNSVLARHLNSALFSENASHDEIQDLAGQLITPGLFYWFYHEPKFIGISGESVSNVTIRITADDKTRPFNLVMNYSMAPGAKSEFITKETKSTNGIIETEINNTLFFYLSGSLSSENYLVKLNLVVEILNQGQLLRKYYLDNQGRNQFIDWVLFQDIKISQFP